MTSAELTVIISIILSDYIDPTVMRIAINFAFSLKFGKFVEKN